MNILTEDDLLARCEEYEKNMCKIVTYNDLLQKADWEDHKMFCGALACVFDIDPLIIGRIGNLDYLWRPAINENDVNYIQWLTLSPDIRDPIQEILSYLFWKTDPVYYERYNKTDKEKDRIRLHMVKIIEKYGTIDKYFECVSTNLWKKSDYIRVNYGGYIPK
jgi:hypothetical protein